jgi:hypothetical protein
VKNSNDKQEKNSKDVIVDGLHEGTKVIASAVPFVSYLHSIFVKSPAEKRLLAMIDKLEQDLQRLQQIYTNLTPESLAENQLFITATSNVLLISVREHREQKLTALRNIVLNTAIPNDLDEDIQLMFIDLIDTFTTWHIKLLVFFSNDNWWQLLGYVKDTEKLDGDDVVAKLTNFYQELTDKSFVNKIVNDLSNNQLIVIPPVGGINSYLLTEDTPDLRLNSPLLSELGMKFIKSITSP